MLRCNWISQITPLPRGTDLQLLKIEPAPGNMQCLFQVIVGKFLKIT